MSRARSFPSLTHPVTVSPDEAFVVEATLDPQQGREAVEHAVRDGFLRPFDIASAQIDDVKLLYVPFWRVAVSVDGFHIGLSSMSVGKEGRTVPIPTGGARHKDAVVMVCARTVFPYETKLPSLFGRVSGVPPLEIEMNELSQSRKVVTWTDSSLHSGSSEVWEIVEPDIERAQAESTASMMVLRAVHPSNALYAKFDPHIHTSTFCLYPLYYARYTYSGEARRHAGEELFVAVSGRTGKIVAAKHPSAARAVAAKVRRLLSFDRR